MCCYLLLFVLLSRLESNLHASTKYTFYNRVISSVVWNYCKYGVQELPTVEKSNSRPKQWSAFEAALDDLFFSNVYFIKSSLNMPWG